MIKLQQVGLSKNWQKLLLLLGIFSNSPVLAQNTSSLNNFNSNVIQAENIQASRKVNKISQREIEQMVTELQDLIYRVESTLITAEAKQRKYTQPMSSIVDHVLKNPPKSNSLTKENKITPGYSNNLASQAIANAKIVAQDFPNLALQDYGKARQTWLDARRSLWDNYPVDRPFAQPEVRAIWLDRGTIVKAKSKEDLKPLFDRMAESGINTVFFETVNASYPIYPSRVAPEQNPMTKGWDPLQASIELAHERGIELHAWAWIFAAANQGHNRLLGQDENYLGPVLSRNPSWVLKDKQGQVFNRTPGFKKAFFDPANPQARRYIMALLEEIATNYDVDGIQLDYIRYPFQDSMTKQQFGYTDVSRALFKENYGIDPIKLTPASPAWSQWTGFRIKQISSFVAEASQRLKQKRPDLIISTAVFPMERKERLFTLQQHWEDWIHSEWVDMMVLMTYALYTGNLEERTQGVYEFSYKNSSLIIPGIRLLNVPNSEAFDQLQSIRNMPSGGFALFAAENFNTGLQAMFKHTQGTPQEVAEPLPHRQPFQSALVRYQALQKEWNFMLMNHQISIAPRAFGIEPRYLKEWSKQADQLHDRFKQLAQNPTEENLELTKKELTALTTKLPNYLAQHKKQQPQQVQTWQNRLITLDNLLQYGERTVIANRSNSQQLTINN
ncbi:glycoside hydrolase family 10 protein [Geminocystis herdmanii]|uniref:glycoside hydrolase family 10 protein n=1 Tax=Geminocystis herdmanii TaxID=669359 RepID=UPI00034C711C|nr:family 10 glycosylhydrolase [Geminocystis herdmanii]